MTAINQNTAVDPGRTPPLQPKSYAKASFLEIRAGLKPKNKAIDQADVTPKPQPSHNEALANAKMNLSRVAGMIEQIRQDVTRPDKSQGTQPQDRINEIIKKMQSIGPARDHSADPSTTTDLKGSPVTLLGKYGTDDEEYSLFDLRSDGPLALDKPMDEPRKQVVDVAWSQLNERRGLLRAVTASGRPAPPGVVELIGFLRPHDTNPQSLALAWEHARELRAALLDSPGGSATPDGASRFGAGQALSGQ